MAAQRCTFNISQTKFLKEGGGGGRFLGNQYWTMNFLGIPPSLDKITAGKFPGTPRFLVWPDARPQLKVSTVAAWISRMDFLGYHYQDPP
jgi:hypothetical protein